MVVRLKTPEELIAAVPHMVGFEVEDSMVVMPLGGGPGGRRVPVARVDLPVEAGERAEMVESLMVAYRHAEGVRVVLVGFAVDPGGVDLAGRELERSLTAAGVEVVGRFWAGDRRWADLDTGQGGRRDPGLVTRLDAELVLRGRPLPATSREAVENGFRGDPGPLLASLPAVTAAMARSTPAREWQWVLGRAEAFAEDGRALSDPEAARMLCGLQSVAVRDQLAARISLDTADSYAPLWDDLTRRAPGDLVVPAATLSAVANWCRGDGARAWCALDRIPPGETGSRSLADLVARVLQAGVDPIQWDQVRSAVLDSVVEEGVAGPASGRPPPASPAAAEAGRPPAGPAR